MHRLKCDIDLQRYIMQPWKTMKHQYMLQYESQKYTAEVTHKICPIVWLHLYETSRTGGEKVTKGCLVSISLGEYWKWSTMCKNHQVSGFHNYMRFHVCVYNVNADAHTHTHNKWDKKDYFTNFTVCLIM